MARWSLPALLAFAVLLSSFATGQPTRQTPLDLPSGGFGLIEEEDERSPEVITFYGTLFEGDAFFWCLDKSGSMQGDRLLTLKQEVSQAIESLSSEAELGLVAFSTNVVWWNSLPRKASHQNKNAATQWALTLVAEGTTCIEAGAVATLRVAGRSTLKDRQVVVVSDGAPSCADGNSDDGLVVQNITTANHERIPIHTLLLGSEAEGPAFMQNLAGANEGTFRHLPGA